jgi:hypothetical protein
MNRIGVYHRYGRPQIYRDSTYGNSLTPWGKSNAWNWNYEDTSTRRQSGNYLRFPSILARGLSPGRYDGYGTLRTSPSGNLLRVLTAKSISSYFYAGTRLNDWPIAQSGYRLQLNLFTSAFGNTSVVSVTCATLICEVSTLVGRSFFLGGGDPGTFYVGTMPNIHSYKTGQHICQNLRTLTVCGALTLARTPQRSTSI